MVDVLVIEIESVQLASRSTSYNSNPLLGAQERTPEGDYDSTCVMKDIFMGLVVEQTSVLHACGALLYGEALRLRECGVRVCVCDR